MNNSTLKISLATMLIYVGQALYAFDGPSEAGPADTSMVPKLTRSYSEPTLTRSYSEKDLHTVPPSPTPKLITHCTFEQPLMHITCSDGKKLDAPKGFPSNFLRAHHKLTNSCIVDFTHANAELQPFLTHKILNDLFYLSDTLATENIFSQPSLFKCYAILTAAYTLDIPLVYKKYAYFLFACDEDDSYRPADPSTHYYMHSTLFENYRNNNPYAIGIIQTLLNHNFNKTKTLLAFNKHFLHDLTPSHARYPIIISTSFADAKNGLTPEADLETKRYALAVLHDLVSKDCSFEPALEISIFEQALAGAYTYITSENSNARNCAFNIFATLIKKKQGLEKILEAANLCVMATNNEVAETGLALYRSLIRIGDNTDEAFSDREKCLIDRGIDNALSDIEIYRNKKIYCSDTLYWLLSDIVKKGKGYALAAACAHSCPIINIRLPLYQNLVEQNYEVIFDDALQAALESMRAADHPSHLNNILNLLDALACRGHALKEAIMAVRQEITSVHNKHEAFNVFKNIINYLRREHPESHLDLKSLPQEEADGIRAIIATFPLEKHEGTRQKRLEFTQKNILDAEPIH